MPFLLWIFLLTFLTTTTEAADLLTVCARPNVGFLTEEAGENQGLELDLLESYAKSLGREIDIKWMTSFSEVLPSVAANQCDLAAAAITVTPERAEIVEFSLPYFPSRAVLAEASEQPLLSMRDLLGKTVAAVTGTIHYDLIADLDGVYVLGVETDRALFRRLFDGTVDALASDSATLVPYLKQYPELKVSLSISDVSSFALAFPKGSAYRQGFDRHFEKLVKSGKWKEMLFSYYGKEGSETLLEMLSDLATRERQDIPEKQ